MIENKKQLVQITIDEGLEQDEDQNNSFSDKDKIVGMCQQFISTNQKGARQLNIYEIPTKDNQNWEAMACHFRNIQYTNENVRTPQTLTNCLEFVCSQYLPYYRKIFTNEAERKRVELFLYDRLRSIKCEFYVQEVFIPKIHLKLFKIILFLETMMGQPVQFSCIQQFIAKQTKLKYYKVEQDQACFSQLIQYAIYLSKKERLLTLLDDYWQDICENQQILKSLENKTKILNKNYVKYLEILMTHPSIYVRLILWSQITRMREIIIGLYKKARLNERAGFICRVLGYAKMDGWINLSEAKDVQRLEKNRKKFDLQIKLWIGEEQLLAGLKDLQISDY